MSEFIHIPQEAFQEVESRYSFTEKDNEYYGKDYFLKGHKVAYSTAEMGFKLYYVELIFWEKDGTDKLKKADKEAKKWHKERELSLESDSENS